MLTHTAQPSTRWRPPRRLVRPVIAFTVAVATWWAAVAVYDIPTFILPAPPDVVDAFARHRGYLLAQAWATLGHTLGGFTVAAIAGSATAMTMAVSTLLRDAVFPLLVIVQVIPMVAVAPLLKVWFGYGLTNKITLVTLVCFFPIVVASTAGLTKTPTELTELADSLTASRWQTLVKIRVPQAYPHMFTGFKVAISLALIGAVIAEMNTPNTGLGMVILRSGQAADTPLAFAAIGLLVTVGITLYFALVGAEKLLLPWAGHTTA